MTERGIYKLLADSERVTLEYRKAQDGMPNSLWGTYSAFVSTDGGILLLGVYENVAEKDSLMRFTTTGVGDADKIHKDLWDIINSREKVDVNLLHDEDVQTIGVNGKEIIAISVPRADYNLRPVYINDNLTRGIYRRNHEGGYRYTEQVIRVMVRDAYEDGNDRMFLEYYTMDDIDIPTLESYRVIFKTNDPERIWSNLDRREFLMQFDGYVTNRRDDTEGLAIAGLLMFGRGLSVRKRLSYLRMGYIGKPSLIGDQRYNDQPTYDGTREE